MSAKQVPSWVMLFEDPNYSGRHLTIFYNDKPEKLEDLEDLRDLRSDDGKIYFNDKASSVMYCIGVGGKCVLYAHPGCQGNHIDLQGTGRLEKKDQKDLKGKKVHDKISSVKWEGFSRPDQDEMEE